MNDYSIFDLFLDLPHPAASTGSGGARVIAPPACVNTASEEIANELYESQSIARITKFAFPEHDDQLHGANMNYKQAVREAYRGAASNGSQNSIVTSGAGLNKLDVYFYSFTYKYHNFTLQLTNGSRVHGHVRRYLPPHREAKSRYDVGRRGSRAMVLLTRAPGGNRFYVSLLKSLEAVSSLNMGTPKDTHNHICPQQAFLFAMQEKQHQIITEYRLAEHGLKPLNIPAQQDHPMANMDSPSDFSFKNDVTDVTVNGTEFGPKSPVVNLDSLRFHLPSVLQPGFTGRYTAYEIDSPMLPLLRCLGPTHTLRLISALMCERRIILISRSASLLSACMSSVASIMAQGLLIWQHIFVSVLPPHLLKYLASETPYVIGLLDMHASKLDILPGISDVLAINLDTNSLQTYRMVDPSQCVPDLLLPQKRKKNDTTVSCAELLAQDLKEVIGADERFWAEARGTKLEAKDIENDMENGDSGAKRSSTKKSKFAVFSKRQPSSRGLGGKDGSAQQEDSAAMLGSIMRNANQRDTMNMGSVVGEDETINTMSQELVGSSEAYDNECSENETAEEGARVAFVTFFLYLYGDMGMCLSEREGKLILDRRKFMACKRNSGILDDSPLYWVLNNFSRTAMFRRFIKCRIQELEMSPEERKRCLPHHVSLFSLCEGHMRQRSVKWSLANIRPVIQKFAYDSPRRKIALWSDHVRKQTLALTANQEFSGNALKSLAELIDQCCEVNGSLCHIMGAVWTRLQDGRAHMWRHPLLGLYVLRNIIMHGPLSAVTEATDGLKRIKALRSYSSAKNQDGARDVRDTATEVYELLVDRSKLFAERRSLSCRRLKLDAPKRSSRWEDYLVRRLPVLVAFNHIHGLLRPKGPQSGGKDRPSNNNFSRRRSSNASTASGTLTSVAEDTKKNGRTKPKINRKSSKQINKDEPDIHNLVKQFNSSMELPKDGMKSVNGEGPPRHVRTTEDYSVASSIDSSVMR